MLNFESDYLEGAHEKILANLVATNEEKLTGYGNDIYCQNARQKIQTACEKPDADIYFISGGTQTNALVIASMLNKTEGVLAAETGHITTHETGAIEFTGHKVLTLPQNVGKISATDVKQYMKNYWNDGNRDFAVQPGMVYISQPTEYGTIYSKKELTAIRAVCDEYKIPLFVDGARLGYALASAENDVSLPELADLVDVFYIGGTKVGALLGEAIVFTKNNTPAHFVPNMKQQGALLAKGRVLGIQFDTLFTDNLYFEISKNAIELADLLKAGLKEKGYQFYLDSPTNQQFIILENQKMEKLKEQVAFGFWEIFDDNHTVIRFATSWATKRADIEALLAIM